MPASGFEASIAKSTYLPEAALAGIRTGSAAQVTLWAGGRTLAGKVREIAPAADPATRTFPARIAITGAEQDLPLGMTATKESKTDSGVIGDVVYTERFDATLASLEPLT